MDNYSAQVPPDLMHQLHEATEHLHECKTLLENAMHSSEYRHQERINAAAERFHQAESEVEEVEKKISQALSMPIDA